MAALWKIVLCSSANGKIFDLLAYIDTRTCQKYAIFTSNRNVLSKQQEFFGNIWIFLSNYYILILDYKKRLPAIYVVCMTIFPAYQERTECSACNSAF